MRILVLLFILSGCNHFLKKSVSDNDITDPDNRELLEARYNEGLAEIEMWSHGWPSQTDCDGLVWASHACSAGGRVDIALAEYNPGEWHRRPHTACYPDDLDGNGRPDSRSTISNDQLVSLMLCMAMTENLGAAERLRDYGQDNNWFMGKPTHRVAEVIMKPHFRGVLYRMIKSLGGDGHAHENLPLALAESDLDYVAHIQTVAILIDTINVREVSQSNLDLLGHYVEMYPEDYFFRTVQSLYTGEDITQMLLDTDHTPSYVRGDEAERFRLAHWLLSARLALKE